MVHLGNRHEYRALNLVVALHCSLARIRRGSLVFVPRHNQAINQLRVQVIFRHHSLRDILPPLLRLNRLSNLLLNPLTSHQSNQFHYLPLIRQINQFPIHLQSRHINRLHSHPCNHTQCQLQFLLVVHP